MHNRPIPPYRLEYSPMRLPPDFPISSGGVYRQLDKPITRLHLHDCLEIGFCHSGTGIFVVEDKVLPFRQGDVSFINHREMHLAQSSKGTVSEWTFVLLDPVRLLGTHVDHPDLLNTTLLGGPRFANVLPGEKHPEISALTRDMVAELAEKENGYQSSVRALIWAILARLHRLPRQQAHSPSSLRRTHTERVAPALQYLAQNYMNAVRIPDLARICGASPTHFRRLFLHAIGKSPLRYLATLRMQMAAALLADTDRTILDISMEVGYATLSSFNRHFRSIMGIAPRQWRKIRGCPLSHATARPRASRK